MHITLPLPVRETGDDTPDFDHLSPDSNPTHAICGAIIKGRRQTTNPTRQLCVVCEDIAATFGLVIK